MPLQTDKYCCMQCAERIHWSTALYGSGMCHKCVMNRPSTREKLRKSFKEFHKKNPDYNRGKNNPMYGKCGDKHHNYGKRIRATEGKNNKNWKGGRILHTNGYIMVRDYNIRSGRSGDYKFEHRLVMEKSLGRKMLHNERIHHINRIKNDNRIENLMLFESPKKHVQYEHGAYNFLIHKNLISEYTKWFNKTKERIK